MQADTAWSSILIPSPATHISAYFPWRYGDAERMKLRVWVFFIPFTPPSLLSSLAICFPGLPALWSEPVPWPLCLQSHASPASSAADSQEVTASRCQMLLTCQQFLRTLSKQKESSRRQGRARAWFHGINNLPKKPFFFIIIVIFSFFPVVLGSQKS